MKFQPIQQEQVTPSLQVRGQSANYKSLFATQALIAETIIAKVDYEKKLQQPDRYSVQINETEHIILSPTYLQYLNHSCTPNVFFDTTDMVLRALRDIKAGEELRFFYPSTEWKMTEAFECICGSPACLGQIQGAAYLTYDSLNKYRLSQYILNKFKNLGKA